MASSSSSPLTSLFLSALFFFSYLFTIAHCQDYNAVFSFGDSLSDAGNLIVNGVPSELTTARKPYGMTYFRKPTGRCSDGRLVVDFLGITQFMYFRMKLLLGLDYFC